MSVAPESGSTLVAKHERLQKLLDGIDAAAHVDTIVCGPTPTITTEIVVSPTERNVPADVLEQIADADLGVDDVSPQGDCYVAVVR